MSLSLQEWIEKEVQPIKAKYSKREIAEMVFFRNELRPRYIDDDVFYSPADGVIINQAIVKADEPLMEIKGMKYNLKDAFMDPWFKGEGNYYMIVDIFLTYYNIHYTKLPYSGIVSCDKVGPITSNNRPMLFAENDLIEGIIDLNKYGFAFTNERAVITVRMPKLFGHEYYLINIADYEVSNIVHYPEEGDYVIQNKDLGQIRYGSQVSFVLPLSDDFEFEFCEKVGRVVKAGIDPIVKIVA